MRKHWLNVVLGILICLPAVWPFLQPQFFHLHDYTHVARLAEMVRAINDGHFPVRWSENLGYGYGMPQFNFYAPLFYYTAAVFYYFGVSLLWSIKLTVIIHYLGSFLAMYAIGNRLADQRIGLLMGTLFIYAPYRAVDTYVRGAFGELSAITFIAFCLWMLVAWIQDKKAQYLIFLTLSVAGLILSHNLVAMIAMPFIVGLIVILGLMQPNLRKMMIGGMAAVILGVGLATFYWWPVLTEKQFTNVETLTTGFSNFHQHFLYLRQLWYSRWGYGGSISGPEDNISFEIGKWLIILSAAGAGLTLIYEKKKWRKGMAITIVLMIVAAVLLMTYKTQWLWERIPIMAYIQFPWRFLSIVIVFGPLLVVGLKLLPKRWQLITKWCVYVGIPLIVMTNLFQFKPEAYLADNSLLYYSDPKEIQTKMSGIIPDFLPNFGSQMPVTPPEQRFVLADGSEPLGVEVNRTHEFLLRAIIDRPTNLTANIFYFPGWEVWVNGVKVPLTINQTTGTFSVLLPSAKGEQIISGRFGETPTRMTADGVSLLCLLVLSYWGIAIRHREQYGIA